MQLSGKHNTFWVSFYHPLDIYNAASAAIFLPHERQWCHKGKNLRDQTQERCFPRGNGQQDGHIPQLIQETGKGPHAPCKPPHMGDSPGHGDKAGRTHNG